MIDALIRFCLRGPFIVIVVACTLVVWGWKSFEENPKDALPDIAENQAIVFTEWMGRSPKDVDEQVTYPLTVAMQGVPGVKEVRATSGFGWSIVYVIFQDDIEFYWARSRVLEKLNPDAICLGYDQQALEEDLQRWMIEVGKEIPIHFLKPYKPNIFHNTLLS